jgi:nitrogen-specific signal transduction histidine kinase/ActR/RegA family two-component response regulator
MVGVLRDITEHKRLQAQFLQSQKMEAIGLLAGGVAHDFNNLLTVIKGYAEVLAEDIDPGDPKRCDVEQILKAGNQAASLTSQLLAFSRKQILQPEILDLNATIRQMSSMLRRLIGEDIDLVTIAHPELGSVNADPVQIQQILMNLAVNARDAMPQGGKLTIEMANAHFDEAYVREHPQTMDGPYVMLAISDNGIGMDAATQARLFEPFFTTKGKGKGTGLGLSTIYGIVKQSGGFIWVYSEQGKGSTFKIYFPRVEGQSPTATIESNVQHKLNVSETVFVVEDEPSVRALTSRILQSRGYAVLEASNGKLALDIAQKHSGEIHMVITDVVMPEMGGKALVSQLKMDRPDIKVLFVSGYADNAIVHHGILDSGIEFLQKPFSSENLLRKVREVLNSHS